MKSRRSLIFILIVGFSIGLVAVLDDHYFDKAWFDHERRISFACSEISAVEISEGFWKWTEREWRFNQSHKLFFRTKQEIDTVCAILTSSAAKYVSNERPHYSLTIKLHRFGSSFIEIELNKNIQGEIFIINDSHTFDGQRLSAYISPLVEGQR